MVRLEETETLASSIGRLALGSSSFPDDAEEQPLELERQLVAKEASLPQEPTFDDVNAVNPNQKVSKMKEFMSNVCTALRTFGVLEVEFSILDSDLVSTQDKIKSLDAQYMEKWDLDLDSYESFEGIYLEGECDSILISKRDFQLLQPEKFINDTIVDFYVEHLKKIKPADARVHFFNSFFFRKLADIDENRSQSIDAESGFQRVREWTKKLNIFLMDYIFIPVNFRLHWSLIVICHPGEVVNFADDELASSGKVPCILHLDSIYGSHRGLESCIRCYLWEEWKERNNDTADDRFTKFKSLQFLRVEAPQQQNLYDCALFMLHYMELFVKQAPIYFSPLNNFIDKDWFHPIEASLKRARIKRMIFELAKTNVQHGSSPGCNAKSSYELKDKDDAEDAEEQPNSLKSASLALEEVEGCHPAAKVRQMKQLVHAMEVAFQNFKKSSQEDYEILKNRLDLECAERRRLHNELIELKGNIRVFCRCRPLNRDEIARGLTSVVDFDSSLENELKIVGADSSEKRFKFDHIFRPEDNQEAVFEQTSPLVVSVLDGFNVCIFAYGQTGTGKTFRMEGTAENRGVNYRTLEKLFSLSEERSDTMRYEMSVSMLEIYNEKIRDLLVKDAKQPAKKLNVKELEVPGLNEVCVLETGDVWKLLECGSSARSVGSTNANEFSSRSHCLLRVAVDGKNLVNGQETRSRLWLVDLARSERAGKTGAQGDRLKEANNINKSLSELRNVISALASKASHIPYRNSKLTRVLQGSLGGDSRTLMFVQISPSQADLGETLSSLRFARDVGVVVRVPARKRFAARQKQQKKKAAVASSHLPISSTKQGLG